ncbi:MAG: alpha/beta hydrolase [Deltaproteobacteria bacterium]|nr:alpha/beta hydrolase [Deltaproteobacteria bacterium]
MRARQGWLRSQDGTKLWYRSIGAGPPILCCNGLGVPSYFWRHLAAHFADSHQVICWDYRGHGRSDQPPHLARLRFDDLAADGIQLVRHLELSNVVGIGHSAGFQVLLGMYAAAPAAFAQLISVQGTAGRTLSDFGDSPYGRLSFDLFYLLSVFYPNAVQLALEALLRTPLPYYIGGLLGWLDTQKLRRREMQHYFDHIRRLTPLGFATLAQAAEAYNMEHVLQTIRIPTLLIATEHDDFVPTRVVHTMQRRIPDSTIAIVHGATHAALMECPDQVNALVEQFLGTTKSGQ